MLVIAYLILVIIIALIFNGLKQNSKSFDFEINFSIKGFKIKFKTYENSAPSTKDKHYFHDSIIKIQ